MHGRDACRFFGQDYKNMDIVVASAKKYNPGVPGDKRLNRTVQAWGDALVLWEAMKRADKAGDLTGPGIMKKGFETMRNYDISVWVLHLSLIRPQIIDPGPAASSRNGKMESFRKWNVDLKERWPEKWAKEWLGW